MKIDNKPGFISRTDKSPASSIRAVKSAQSGSSRSSAVLSSVPEGFSRRDIFFTNLESLLKILDRKSNVQRSLIPLLQLMKQLPTGKEGLPADTSDSRLLLTVIRQWKGLYAPDLPGKLLSDLETLERVFQEEEGEKYFLILKEDPRRKIPELLIREKNSRGKEDGTDRKTGHSQLDLSLNLKRLGPVRVVLEERGEMKTCLIQCQDKKSHKIIRRNLSRLKDQINKRGLTLHNLKVQKKDLSSPDKTEEDGKHRIILWG
ncbi:flagellar hook-length control protein FliK [Oceanispirochaeta sp.]|jgi:hypothetical protein|uniref:flagellar hook-length control protein FliK n=1 Tax=Oceanispirochaeta sp. TaxID=2035350 RepID=UPI00261B6686|nr:flagellar hook-length control protein FliK [Oceanispirochaeta sp.]MDA3957706.1 flagellar hook-length control protein FliK [Oceanispirochaeta sp.]